MEKIYYIIIFIFFFTVSCSKKYCNETICLKTNKEVNIISDDGFKMHIINKKNPISASIIDMEIVYGKDIDIEYNIEKLMLYNNKYSYRSGENIITEYSKYEHVNNEIKIYTYCSHINYNENDILVYFVVKNNNHHDYKMYKYIVDSVEIKKE